MIQKFFIQCSGADSQLLDTCPPSERTKYAGIGATVFFTALMACIAASYALYTVFDAVFPAIAFGVVWGLLIFNLDRYIVSTLRKRDNFWRELLQASPRLLLAIIIAVVISKPLEMKMFEKEIDQVLLKQKNELTLANQQQLALQYDPAIAELEQQISSYKEEIVQKEKQTDDLYDTYIGEAEGRAGTFLLGKGPVYQEKREKHDASLAELQELRVINSGKILEAEARISDLEAGYTAAVNTSQPVIDRFDGLMARVNALNELPWLPSLFIFLLFIAIESAPILVKLMAPKGPYDLKLEEEESIVETWVHQKVDERNKILATEVQLNEKVYSQIAEENTIYAYKKEKAEDLLRLQADRFHEIQVKNL